MRRLPLLTTFAAALCLAGVAAQAAGTRAVHPADRAENRIIPMYGHLPACEDPAVLGEISNSFNSREAKFWGPLRAISFDSVRPIAWRPWGDDLIPRRFCTARMMTNEGVLRRVDYSVRENLGFLGLTWNVNWCVSGLDPLRSYAPDCKMARP